MRACVSACHDPAKQLYMLALYSAVETAKLLAVPHCALSLHLLRRKSLADTSFMFMVDRPNPYDVTGAIVGGPADNDTFIDIRNDYQYTEVGFNNIAQVVHAIDTVQRIRCLRCVALRRQSYCSAMRMFCKAVTHACNAMQVAIDYNAALTVALVSVISGPRDLFKQDCSSMVPRYPKDKLRAPKGKSKA